MSSSGTDSLLRGETCGVHGGVDGSKRLGARGVAGTGLAGVGGVNFVGDVVVLGVTFVVVGDIGAGGCGGAGSIMAGLWFGKAGVYLLRNLLFLNVILPDPSTLSLYW